MLAAAQAAAAIPGEAVIIAALGTVGVIATAFGPALLERFRRPAVTAPAVEQPTAPPTPVVAPASEAAQDAYDMLEGTVSDLRAQRDAALARAERLDEEIRTLRQSADRRIEDLSRRLHAAEMHIARTDLRSSESYRWGG